MSTNKCRHCERLLPCYEHCQDADDGKHIADWSSVHHADGADITPERVVFDVNCDKCGQSGSISIDPRTQEVYWA
jgi:hypothetical protein